MCVDSICRTTSSFVEESDIPNSDPKLIPEANVESANQDHELITQNEVSSANATSSEVNGERATHKQTSASTAGSSKGSTSKYSYVSA